MGKKDVYAFLEENSYERLSREYQGARKINYTGSFETYVSERYLEWLGAKSRVQHFDSEHPFE